jgi:hypothetical protein
MSGLRPIGVKLAGLRPDFATTSWCAKAHHPRLAVPIEAKAWMPTCVGMTAKATAGSLF